MKKFRKGGYCTVVNSDGFIAVGGIHEIVSIGSDWLAVGVDKTMADKGAEGMFLAVFKHDSIPYKPTKFEKALYEL